MFPIGMGRVPPGLFLPLIVHDEGKRNREDRSGALGLTKGCGPERQQKRRSERPTRPASARDRRVRQEPQGSRGDYSELLFGEAVVCCDLNGGPSVADRDWGRIRVAEHCLDEFLSTVFRSACGFQDQVDLGVAIQFSLLITFGHVAAEMSLALEENGVTTAVSTKQVDPCQPNTTSMREPSGSAPGRETSVRPRMVSQSGAGRLLLPFSKRRSGADGPDLNLGGLQLQVGGSGGAREQFNGCWDVLR